MFFHITTQSLIVFGFVNSSYLYSLLGYVCILLFFIPFVFFAYDLSISLYAKRQQVEDKLLAINESCFIAVFNSKGDIIETNHKFNLLFCVDSFNGIQHTDLMFLEDFDRTSYYEFWKKLLSGLSKSGIYRFRSLNLKEKWARCSYTPIKSKSGAVYKILLVGSDCTEDRKNRLELQRKNIYLEHAAKIIRHDMHSGIKTYIPRGIKSLKRRLKYEDIKRLKLEAPLKLLEEGLTHSQLVYNGVYEFTNLVKDSAEISKELTSLADLLREYLSRTSYSDQVAIDFLPTIEVNRSLFCTAIDNLIRNGIKYNDSPFKMVAIAMIDENHLAVIDNGRGLTNKEFEHLCNPYSRKKNQIERGSGLGLNITKAILNEHGFSMFVEEQESGTMIKIRIKND